jgi:hypothetical protein
VVLILSFCNFIEHWPSADGFQIPPHRQCRALAAILNFMFKYISIPTLLLLTIQFASGQQLVSDDNKVYSALIKSEIIKTTKSVTIINKLQNDKESSDWVTEAIKTKDPQQIEQLRFLTRDNKGNSVRSIDTTIQNDILRFYESLSKDSTLHGQFDIDVKVFMVDNSPFKKSSQDEWKKFYKKYPSSGGLFQFSNIYYSADGKTAIFYHSLSRHGLNAHGAIAIMTNGTWQIKYHINFWQA